jgi:hypothetical protein
MILNNRWIISSFILVLVGLLGQLSRDHWHTDHRIRARLPLPLLLVSFKFGSLGYVDLGSSPCG